MTQNLQNQDFNSTLLENDEIDLKSLLKPFLRNKIFIGSISLLFFIFACIYAINKKKLWEGQFEIVLDSQKSENALMQINPVLRRFAGLASGGSNNLKTEVGILESPSVLMPVFELVKTKKKELNKLDENFNFYDWKKNNLNIELKEGTSILNISYRDTYKENILPVLEKMTATYQTYSGRNKKKSQYLTKNYLSQQISIFKEKSTNSIKKAQEYAIDQDLNFVDFEINNQFEELAGNPRNIEGIPRNNILIPNIGIESIRVDAANEIRKIDFQIKTIKEIGKDYDKLQYIGSTIPALVEEGLPQSLSNIEDELVDLRSKYTDKDLSIIRLNQKRDLIIDLLKKRSIGILEAQRIVAESKLKSAVRPKGVLLKYKELIREAERDESTLIELENQMRIVELDAAKKTEPWELITDPTLLDYPVGPNKRRIAFLGLFSGFFISSAFAIYKEKKSGKIFDIEDLNRIFPIPFFELDNRENLELSDNFKILKYFLETEEGDNVYIFPLGENETNNIPILKNYSIFKNGEKKEKRVKFCFNENELRTLKSTDVKLLLGSLGKINKKEIENLKKRFSILNIEISGFILLDNSKTNNI